MRAGCPANNTRRREAGGNKPKVGHLMALALSLEKLDGLDPAVAGLYVEKDGKFILDVDGLEDTSGLKSALEAERKARKDFEKKYGALKDVDPEEYARLKKEAEDRENKDLESKGEFEKLMQKRAKEIEDLKAAHGQEKAALQSLLDKHVKEDRVRTAALKAGVIPEDIEDVMVITGRYFKLSSDGTVQVLDEAGEVTLKTVEEFFTKDFKERKPKFYAATGSSGGGTAGGGGGGGTGTVRTRADLKSVKEKNDYIEKHGLDAWKKLPAK
jgi:hypothetical protein